MLVGTKPIIVGILLIKYAQLYIIKKLASKSMKIGPLLKCILNQHFLARLTFTFFILLFGGPKGPPNKSVYPKMLV